MQKNVLTQFINLVRMQCSYWNKDTREAVVSEPWNCTSLPRGQKLEFFMQGLMVLQG